MREFTLRKSYAVPFIVVLTIAIDYNVFLRHSHAMESTVHGRCPLVEIPCLIIIDPYKTASSCIAFIPCFHLSDGCVHVSLVIGTACMTGGASIEIPVSGIVVGSAVIALHHNAVYRPWTIGMNLGTETCPETLIRVRSEGSFIAKPMHHNMELGG